MAKRMTAKQERFVEEFCCDWNATQAAIRAGYSKASASSIGAALLRKVQVAAAVEERRAAISKDVQELTMDAARTIRENARIGLFDIRKLFDSAGRMFEPHELDDDTAAAIVGIEMGVFEKADGTTALYIKKVKIADKGAAIDRTMKMLGLYQTANEQTTNLAVAMFTEMRNQIVKLPTAHVQAVVNPPNQHRHQ